LSRKSDIDLVIHGRSDLIINRNIPNLFANDNHNDFKNEIAKAIEIANSTPDNGILGALRGMADRPDRNSVLEKLTNSTMMIFGVKDNLIPLSVAESLAQRHKKTRTVYLNNSGHMGFIEERDQALKAIISFVNDIFL
jgi:pimeloyl-ACP methyl ester carboxylesterase